MAARRRRNGHGHKGLWTDWEMGKKKGEAAGQPPPPAAKAARV